jgi:hypothetical protein
VTSETANVGPPQKECEDARKFIEHRSHTWFKKDRPEWQYHCDGILPEDQQPPCQIYISPEQPECGEPAPTTVHVKTALIDARVDVCARHKAQHDTRSAAIRAARSRNDQLGKAS